MMINHTGFEWAFIAVLFESGCRKGELKTLKIRDLSFGVTYTEIRVNGKTGERTVPLVFSVPYLRAWLQVHPDRRPDQWLFAFERYGKIDQMKGSSPNGTIRYICVKAGIRHIHPHMLRHTRSTELARAGLSEYQMDGHQGWVVGSKSPRRYIHLSGREHINAALEAQGIEVPRESRPKPMLSEGRCPQCDGLVGASMLHCPGCGFILDPNMRGGEAAGERGLDEMLEELRRDREQRNARMDALEEKILRQLRGSG